VLSVEVGLDLGPDGFGKYPGYSDTENGVRIGIGNRAEFVDGENGVGIGIRTELGCLSAAGV